MKQADMYDKQQEFMRSHEEEVMGILVIGAS